MSRNTFDDSDDRPGSRPAPAPRSPLACAADGCPWTGSAGDHGRFLCIAHFGADSSAWPAITGRTNELRWFANFIGDAQRMANHPRRGEASWSTFAEQFWANSDPRMMPTPAESKAPGLYQYRMHGELRAMALGIERPKPHVPHGRSPEWQPRKASAPVPEATLPAAIPMQAIARAHLPAAPTPAPDLASDPPAWVTEGADA